jgi:hypothetical protein
MVTCVSIKIAKEVQNNTLISVSVKRYGDYFICKTDAVVRLDFL